MDSKAASARGCSKGSWLPATLYPSSLLAPCLQGTSRRVLDLDLKDLLGAPPGGEGQEEEDEQAEFVYSDAETAAGEETVSSFTQSSASDAEDLDSSSDLGTEGQLPLRVESVAKQPAAEKEVKPDTPNFAGVWDLVRTEGDLDRFLSDMGQGWLMRNGALVLKYGIGRVVVECQQDGDDLEFSKVLCDPRNSSKSHVHVTVGQGTARFLDDVGRLSSTSRWSGSSLVFDAKLESSGLSLTVLMYYNSEGNLVQEMISHKTVVKYIFERRA